MLAKIIVEGRKSLLLLLFIEGRGRRPRLSTILGAAPPSCGRRLFLCPGQRADQHLKRQARLHLAGLDCQVCVQQMMVDGL